jgi:hypothetical protein
MRYRALITVAAAYVIIVSATAALSNVRAATLAPLLNTGSCNLPFDIQCYLPGGKHEDPDVAREADITADTELAAVMQIQRNPPHDLFHAVTLLGKAELYDSTLSVYKNVACATCHVADTGFTNPSSRLAPALIDFPGSVKITNVSRHHPNVRIGDRRPQTYGYAPYMQVLHYDSVQKDFYGGNFWDMRATGLRLGNPAAEQAEGPPTNPNEMGLSDTACVVYALFRRARTRRSSLGSGVRNRLQFTGPPASRASAPNQDRLRRTTPILSTSAPSTEGPQTRRTTILPRRLRRTKPHQKLARSPRNTTRGSRAKQI